MHTKKGRKKHVTTTSINNAPKNKSLTTARRAGRPQGSSRIQLKHSVPSPSEQDIKTAFSNLDTVDEKPEQSKSDDLPTINKKVTVVSQHWTVPDSARRHRIERDHVDSPEHSASLHDSSDQEQCARDDLYNSRFPNSISEDDGISRLNLSCSAGLSAVDSNNQLEFGVNNASFTSRKLSKREMKALLKQTKRNRAVLDDSLVAEMDNLSEYLLHCHIDPKWCAYRRPVSVSPSPIHPLTEMAVSEEKCLPTVSSRGGFGSRRGRGKRGSVASRRGSAVVKSVEPITHFIPQHMTVAWAPLCLPAALADRLLTTELIKLPLKSPAPRLNALSPVCVKNFLAIVDSILFFSRNRPHNSRQRSPSPRSPSAGVNNSDVASHQQEMFQPPLSNSAFLLTHTNTSTENSTNLSINTATSSSLDQASENQRNSSSSLKRFHPSSLPETLKTSERTDSISETIESIPETENSHNTKNSPETPFEEKSANISLSRSHPSARIRKRGGTRSRGLSRIVNTCQEITKIDLNPDQCDIATSSPSENPVNDVISVKEEFDVPNNHLPFPDSVGSEQTILSGQSVSRVINTGKTRGPSIARRELRGLVTWDALMAAEKQNKIKISKSEITGYSHAMDARKSGSLSPLTLQMVGLDDVASSGTLSSEPSFPRTRRRSQLSSAGGIISEGTTVHSGNSGVDQKQSFIQESLHLSLSLVSGGGEDTLEQDSQVGTATEQIIFQCNDNSEDIASTNQDDFFSQNGNSDIQGEPNSKFSSRFRGGKAGRCRKRRNKPNAVEIEELKPVDLCDVEFEELTPGRSTENDDSLKRRRKMSPLTHMNADNTDILRSGDLDESLSSIDLTTNAKQSDISSSPSRSVLDASLGPILPPRKRYKANPTKKDNELTSHEPPNYKPCLTHTIVEPDLLPEIEDKLSSPPYSEDVSTVLIKQKGRRGRPSLRRLVADRMESIQSSTISSSRPKREAAAIGFASLVASSINSSPARAESISETKSIPIIEQAPSGNALEKEELIEKLQLEQLDSQLNVDTVDESALSSLMSRSRGRPRKSPLAKRVNIDDSVKKTAEEHVNTVVTTIPIIEEHNSPLTKTDMIPLTSIKADVSADMEHSDSTVACINAAKPNNTETRKRARQIKDSDKDESISSEVAKSPPPSASKHSDSELCIPHLSTSGDLVHASHTLRLFLLRSHGKQIGRNLKCVSGNSCLKSSICSKTFDLLRGEIEKLPGRNSLFDMAFLAEPLPFMETVQDSEGVVFFHIKSLLDLLLGASSTDYEPNTRLVSPILFCPDPIRNPDFYRYICSSGILSKFESILGCEGLLSSILWTVSPSFVVSRESSGRFQNAPFSNFESEYPPFCLRSIYSLLNPDSNASGLPLNNLTEALQRLDLLVDFILRIWESFAGRRSWLGRRIVMIRALYSQLRLQIIPDNSCIDSPSTPTKSSVGQNKSASPALAGNSITKKKADRRILERGAEVIRCLCGFRVEAGHVMVHCDGCATRQHLPCLWWALCLYLEPALAAPFSAKKSQLGNWLHPTFQNHNNHLKARCRAALISALIAGGRDVSSLLVDGRPPTKLGNPRDEPYLCPICLKIDGLTKDYPRTLAAALEEDDLLKVFPSNPNMGKPDTDYCYDYWSLASPDGTDQLITDEFALVHRDDLPSAINKSESLVSLGGKNKLLRASDAVVLRIYRLWKNSNGTSWMEGGVFPRPYDLANISPETTPDLWHPREVVYDESSRVILPVSVWCGRCSVLSPGVYRQGRPMDIPGVVISPNPNELHHFSSQIDSPHPLVFVCDRMFTREDNGDLNFQEIAPTYLRVNMKPYAFMRHSDSSNLRTAFVRQSPAHELRLLDDSTRFGEIMSVCLGGLFSNSPVRQQNNADESKRTNCYLKAAKFKTPKRKELEIILTDIAAIREPRSIVSSTATFHHGSRKKSTIEILNDQTSANLSQKVSSNAQPNPVVSKTRTPVGKNAPKRAKRIVETVSTKTKTLTFSELQEKITSEQNLLSRRRAQPNSKQSAKQSLIVDVVVQVKTPTVECLDDTSTRPLFLDTSIISTDSSEIEPGTNIHAKPHFSPISPASSLSPNKDSSFTAGKKSPDFNRSMKKSTEYPSLNEVLEIACKTEAGEAFSRQSTLLAFFADKKETDDINLDLPSCDKNSGPIPSTVSPRSQVQNSQLSCKNEHIESMSNSLSHELTEHLRLDLEETEFSHYFSTYLTNQSLVSAEYLNNYLEFQPSLIHSHTSLTIHGFEYELISADSFSSHMLFSAHILSANIDLEKIDDASGLITNKEKSVFFQHNENSHIEIPSCIHQEPFFFSNSDFCCVFQDFSFGEDNLGHIQQIPPSMKTACSGMISSNESEIFNLLPLQEEKINSVAISRSFICDYQPISPPSPNPLQVDTNEMCEHQMCRNSEYCSSKCDFAEAPGMLSSVNDNCIIDVVKIDDTPSSIHTFTPTTTKSSNWVSDKCEPRSRLSSVSSFSLTKEEDYTQSSKVSSVHSYSKSKHHHSNTDSYRRYNRDFTKHNYHMSRANKHKCDIRSSLHHHSRRSRSRSSQRHLSSSYNVDSGKHSGASSRRKGNSPKRIVFQRVGEEKHPSILPEDVILDLSISNSEQPSSSFSSSSASQKFLP